MFTANANLYINDLLVSVKIPSVMSLGTLAGSMSQFRQLALESTHRPSTNSSHSRIVYAQHNSQYSVWHSEMHRWSIAQRVELVPSVSSCKWGIVRINDCRFCAGARPSKTCLNQSSSPPLYLGQRPVSTGLIMLSKLSNTVVKRIGWITEDKSSWVS